jgi:glycosyltransferase involved in cell wall biosynthesis
MSSERAGLSERSLGWAARSGNANDLGTYERAALSEMLPFDSVYFLMWVGWKDELRSNRWHYATRFTQIAPVVLVQPDLPPGFSQEGMSEPELRIPNCRILHIDREDSDDPSAMLNQVAQIQRDMEAHGYRRPLLWLYNPRLLGVYSAIPATARVVHSTENHFEFPALPDGFLERLKACLQLSDLIIAVSSGVHASIVKHVPDTRIVTVSNGCDYRAYAAGEPDAELDALRGGYAKLAIYAGNINYRIDFDLLISCAQSFPDTLFVLVGPVKGSAGPGKLDPDDQAAWERLLELRNFRHTGPVDPDRLPNMYAAADVGIIPYRDLPVIRESGFALKALEMLATGLPVVSSLMRPLEGLSDGLVVTGSPKEFIERFGVLERGALSSEVKAQMRDLCRSSDYDVKFRFALGRLAEAVEPDRPAVSDLIAFAAELRRLCARYERRYGAVRAQNEELFDEIKRLNTVYMDEIKRLHQVYGGEVERLHRLYADQIQVLQSAVSSPEPSERFRARLGWFGTGKLRWVRSQFRRASLLLRAVRHPRKAWRLASSLVVRSVGWKRSRPDTSMTEGEDALDHR